MGETDGVEKMDEVDEAAVVLEWPAVLLVYPVVGNVGWRAVVVSTTSSDDATEVVSSFAAAKPARRTDRTSGVLSRIFQAGMSFFFFSLSDGDEYLVKSNLLREAMVLKVRCDGNEDRKNRQEGDRATGPAFKLEPARRHWSSGKRHARPGERTETLAAVARVSRSRNDGDAVLVA